MWIFRLLDVVLVYSFFSFSQSGYNLINWLRQTDVFVQSNSNTRIQFTCFIRHKCVCFLCALCVYVLMSSFIFCVCVCFFVGWFFIYQLSVAAFWYAARWCCSGIFTIARRWTHWFEYYVNPIFMMHFFPSSLFMCLWMCYYSTKM